MRLGGWGGLCTMHPWGRGHGASACKHRYTLSWLTFADHGKLQHAETLRASTNEDKAHVCVSEHPPSPTPTLTADAPPAVRLGPCTAFKRL